MLLMHPPTIVSSQNLLFMNLSTKSNGTIKLLVKYVQFFKIYLTELRLMCLKFNRRS